MQSDTLNCRCCGGTLNYTSNICICKHCGAANFISDIANKNIIQLNRANKLRQESEFDNAARIYDNILSENGPSADILWYRTLCEYGIEYVPDPVTYKYFPTLHRINDESIKDNAFFKQALELSDENQKETLVKEAEYIDEIQIKYLNIAANEKPYDVFICYKETDAESGENTEDVKLCEELYNELTGRGFKVFFARETLKNKLSIDYEPYIFAALKSAKAMTVIGSKSEYFTSVWVKNEWGRFLRLMEKNPEKKMFFACDDPEELPRAFASKQAQLLGKEGAIKNLAGNVEKFLKENKRLLFYVEETVISEDQQLFDKELADNSENFIKYLENTEFDKKRKELIEKIEKEKNTVKRTNNDFNSYYNLGAIWLLASFAVTLLAFFFTIMEYYYYPTPHFDDTRIFLLSIVSTLLFLDIGVAIILIPYKKWVITATILILVTVQILLIILSLTFLDLFLSVLIPALILCVGLLYKKSDRYYLENKTAFNEANAFLELLRNLKESGKKEFYEFAAKELVEFKRNRDSSDDVQIKDYQFEAVKPLISKHIEEDVNEHSEFRKYHLDSYRISKNRRIRTIVFFAISLIIGAINLIAMILGPLPKLIMDFFSNI